MAQKSVRLEQLTNEKRLFRGFLMPFSGLFQRYAATNTALASLLIPSDFFLYAVYTMSPELLDSRVSLFYVTVCIGGRLIMRLQIFLQ